MPGSVQEPGFQLVKKASQSSPPESGEKIKTFSAGACTWQKIHLRLLVWNLYAPSGQIMHAADCKYLSKNPPKVFRQSKRPALCKSRALCSVAVIGFLNSAF